MSALISRIISKLVRFGRLHVEFHDGTSGDYGDGTGPAIAIRFADKRAMWELVRDPELKLGELYMDGRLLLTQGDLYDFLAIGSANLWRSEGLAWIKLMEKARDAIKAWKQRNDRRRARKNVATHYDLDHRLYDLFLDADRQYSCAYFEHPEQTLEEAQLAKKRHIAAKMLVDERHRVLDIGCGFGGMGLYLARQTGARVVGVTLSQEQLAISQARAQEAGLAARVDFRLEDYRDVEGPFDRIVSVGMFEHVGQAHFDEFFDHVSRLLADDGVMLLHAIGRSSGPGYTNPWVAKYIFPGGYIPAVSEVLASIEKFGLFVTDVEMLRLHYADTLKIWRKRFNARRDEARALYDERFCRMWDFYLAGSETAFRVAGNMVFQIQIAKRQDVVPLTRDYVAAREEALRRAETPAAIPRRQMALASEQR
ncbi:MAG: class I SAM-dependent methyltransferase [Pseudomonadota bacterium]|nr:class I SAM-dependent methyltransferase [Pseudomonadota bacterium]